ARQGEKPRVKIPPWIETANLRGDAQPGLLKEVFRFRRLAHKTKQVAIKAMLIPLHESCKGIQVSASKPCNFGVQTHKHLHRNGSRAYHTLLYTNGVAKKMHGRKVSSLWRLNRLQVAGKRLKVTGRCARISAVKEILRELLELQDVDARLATVRARLATFPKRLAELNARLEAGKAALEKAKES